MKKIIKLIPLMLILVLALTSCQKNAENSGKPKVYTSFYAMYDFTKTIGGDPFYLKLQFSDIFLLKSIIPLDFQSNVLNQP